MKLNSVIRATTRAGCITIYPHYLKITPPPPIAIGYMTIMPCQRSHKRRFPTTPLHWLPINKRAVYKRMVLTFNSLHRNGPAYIKTALNWYTPPRDLRSRNIPSLIPVKSRSIRINNRLLQGGSARQWNSLPKSIKCAASLTIFKKQLKTYLFTL